MTNKFVVIEFDLLANYDHRTFADKDQVKVLVTACCESVITNVLKTPLVLLFCNLQYV